MHDSTLSSAEHNFFSELLWQEVPFMLVGMSAALLQGARGATEDIDIWFADLSDPRIPAIVKQAGGIWISGNFSLDAPRIGGDSLGTRLDIVTHLSGLGSFPEERAHQRQEEVDGLKLPVLSLDRILASKLAANRPKDRAVIESLKDAQLVRQTLQRDSES